MWKKSDIPESVEKLKAEGYSDLASLVMAKACVDSKEKAEEFVEQVRTFIIEAKEMYHFIYS